MKRAIFRKFVWIILLALLAKEPGLVFLLEGDADVVCFKQRAHATTSLVLLP